MTTVMMDIGTGAKTATRPQLRIATAGSVDDGKSTLIGRLLHDTKTIFEDQLAAVGRASKRYGDGEFNLALLTDGLRAEREQGITIDVAYRYFATPARSFIVADTPGHAQYTRNMVTGASVSDLAIVLVDARNGMSEQTRRHAFVSAMLGVHQIVLAVNKMDLVDWDQGTFDRIAKETAEYVQALPNPVPVTAIPISALLGDNVVDRSENTPWYDGPALLELLETIDVTDQDVVGARLAVQWIIRPHGSEFHDYRGYAGQLTGGALEVGDAVVVLPQGHATTVTGIDHGGVPVSRAEAGQAVSIQLAHDLDASRGDVIVAANARLAPVVTDSVIADVCWMIGKPLTPGSRWIAKHRTRTVKVTVEAVLHRRDITSLEPHEDVALEMNDLGQVRLRFTAPLAVDRYDDHREGGRLVLIDEATSTTAGALMIRSTS